MWGASNEPPGTMEGGPPELESDPMVPCDQDKSELETFKEMVIMNKQSLKMKEEKAQEYAKRLNKFKSRAKYSRRSKDGAASLGEASAKSSSEAGSVDETTPDDVSQAKAKSSLLQKKLAEDREMFERRSKEMTESKRAVEEKVEAIKQQLDEKTAILESSLYQTSVNQSMAASSRLTEKDNKITELSNRVLELEAMVLDLQENLKEKDSVIESKMQAVTLMSADLSKKGKTTLDTLEDTKDEMRSMQENFVLIESSLKSKNNSLLEQLNERDEVIAGLEDNIKKLEERLEAQKLAESASADFSRSTMDTLLDTKDAMKSMQENFIVVESSLKSKNDYLLEQLEERELRLAEAQARILQLESGAGIVKPPQLEDLEYKISKLDQNNRELQNEKYELQKTVADLQNKLLSNEPSFTDGIVIEKDNRIAELENLVEELRKSNQLLEEESREELQNQIAELMARNEELITKVGELEQNLDELRTQKSGNAGEATSNKDEDNVAKLTKELDELNKSMIKLKVQHKNQVKNLRRQLENFRKVSDTNAELVRLGNQVALLEEEKGNLQLSLVDFDELKASAGDLNVQIANLEGKVAAQIKEIEMHIEAIAQLENQKLDLTQELITAKQEISTLEAENAESENLRVTAEMKIVELEEQLETFNKSQLDNKQTESNDELETLRKQVDALMQENADLTQKLMKSDEKGSSDAGSTESFETIHETDKNELLKTIESLTQKNAELENKLSKLDNKSTVDSTDSFENINDIDKNELMKRVDLLTRENNDLVLKLSRYEEKGSSDTGSTESFEKIPEHVETISKIDLLTRENNELVIKTIKLEEKLNELNSQILYFDKRNKELASENNDLKEKESTLSREINTPNADNRDLTLLENQLEEYKAKVEEQKDVIDSLKLKLADQDEELKYKIGQLLEVDNLNSNIDSLQRELRDSHSMIEEWKYKYAGLEEKVQLLEAEKVSIEQTLETLQMDKVNLSAQLEEKEEALANERANMEELQGVLEMKSQEFSSIEKSKEQEIFDLKQVIEDKNWELEDKYHKLQNQMIDSDKLHEELIEQRSINDEKSAVISSLKEEISKLNSKSEEREVFLKKATEEYDELLQDLTNKTAACNLLQIRVDEYKNEVKELKEKLESLNLGNEEQRTFIEDLENRLYDSQGMLDNNNIYVNELKHELLKAQELGEKMNVKFIQDTENYNRRLEEVLLQLQEKTTENETLIAELKEKEAMIDLNRTTETKTNLELKISELQKEIEEKVDKMKRYAVKLKKKTIQYNELEQKVINLEGQMQEKENKLSELEGQLENMSETTIKLTQQLNESQNHLESITRKIQSVGEEHIEGLIERLHKQKSEIDEAKEKARELGVRMQVMESEYVDQLFDIQTLQAKNGLLLSKQEQINERLENAEKISEERRSLLEQIESERESQGASKEEIETQTAEESREHCDHCENLHVVVREMEAKLQKRETETENFESEKKEVEDTPMFDAFKAFDMVPDHELTIKRLQSQIDERENQCSKLSEELEKLSNQIKEERLQAQQAQASFSEEILQLQSKLGTVNMEYANLGSQLQRHLNPLCGADKEEIELLKKTVDEKNKELEHFSNELAILAEENNRIKDEKSLLHAKLEITTNNYEEQLHLLKSEKDSFESIIMELEDKRVIIQQMQQEIEALQITICNLEQKEEEDNKLIDDNARKIEIERIALIEEVEKHQNDNADLHARLKEFEEELNNMNKQKTELENEVSKLRKTLEEREQLLLQKSEKAIGEPLVQIEEANTVSQIWDEENIEKLELEEGWVWNSEQAQESTSEVKPVNLEAELLAKITNLECEIKNLEREKQMLVDNNKALQEKCDKAMKKLMKKIKQEKMMQMHQQKSSNLYDLDQAIVDELKLQVSSLEATLSQTQEKYNQTLADKENLAKRIEVLVAANERYLEMKERQDRNMEVCEIRNKELSTKVEALTSQLQMNSLFSNETQGPVTEAQISSSGQPISESTLSLCETEKHQEQIIELKEQVEALSAENDQLQKLLDEQRNTRLELESLTQSTYDKLKNDHDNLLEEYEKTIADADERVKSISKEKDDLQEEFNERAAIQEAKMNEMEENLKREILAVEDELQQVVLEKEALMEKLENLTNVEEKFSTASMSLTDASDLLNTRVQEVAALKEELKRQCDDRLLMERSLRESNERLLININEKQIQLDEYISIINEKDHLIYQHGEEIKTLKERLEELDYSRKEYLSELSLKNADIERHMQELKRLQEIVNERESVFSACQVDTESKDVEISDKHSRILECELEVKKYAEEVKKYLVEVQRLKDTLYEEAARRGTMLEETLGLKVDLTEKTLRLEKCSSAYEKCLEDMEKESRELDRLNEIIQRDQVEIERLSSIMQSESVNFNTLINHLTLKDQQITEIKQALAEKEEIINNANQALADKQLEIDKFNELNKKEPDPLDSIPIFTMTGDEDVEKLKAELVAKQVEIDNLTYALNKNTYPRILQDLQDTINKLYNDKAQLEMDLANCEEENEKLKQKLNNQIQEFQSREEAKHESIEKRLISNQEEIVRLQNELHLKDQEINELKFVIGEKDAKLQASIETSPEDLEIQKTIEMLNTQLFDKYREIEFLNDTVNSLRNDIENAKKYETLSEEYKAALELLQTEKEQTVQEYEEKIKMILEENNIEIKSILNNNEIEKKEILEEIILKTKEIESLHRQMDECHEQMNEQDKEIVHARSDLAEKERRLAELSITKDTEIHNLKVLLHERDVTIEELHALSEEEDKQLSELKAILAKKEKELEDLKLQLAEKIQEVELVQSVLKRHIPENPELDAKTDVSGSREGDNISNELDLALYMLHQRDVRCDELTLELMQLLEERDTLQLRLSNAIRVNEELRKLADTGLKESEASASAPQVEMPSPTKSDGPVEIAKEAIHTPITLDEDKDALVKNEGCAEPVECSTELAVGEKYPEGSPHVIDDDAK